LAAFKEFLFQWRHQYRRQYPDEFFQGSAAKGKDNAQVDYVPAPRVTEADESNNISSLKRALDHRLYLIMHGTPYGAPKDKPLWHFLEKLYTNQETLRECATSTLKSVIGGLSDCYFVGKSPCAHIIVQSKLSGNIDPSYFKTTTISAENAY
jgi:large subunit ribosomal protein L46